MMEKVNKVPAKRYKVSAPGKLIISGEHAVVYGYPALVTAVDKRLTVSCAEKKIKITSNIPIGAGMGSSAAFAVAKSAIKVGKPNLEKINGLAYEMEKVQHGNPSGVDNTISTYGGFLWYRKEAENLKTFKQITPKIKFSNIFLIYTGKPKESTKEMVSHVADLYRNDKAHFDRVFREIEKITREFLKVLLDESKTDFSSLIKENERLLEALDVVSPKTKRLIRKLEALGGAAKISGAGGLKDASGVLIAYHKDANKLKEFAKRSKLELMKVKLGEEGVRFEK